MYFLKLAVIKVRWLDALTQKLYFTNKMKGMYIYNHNNIILAILQCTQLKSPHEIER